MAAQILIAHFNSAAYFNRAADCLLACATDPRLRAELSTTQNEALLYSRRNLVERLGMGKGSKRGALVDKQRGVKLRMLLA